MTHTRSLLCFTHSLSEIRPTTTTQHSTAKNAKDAFFLIIIIIIYKLMPFKNNLTIIYINPYMLYINLITLTIITYLDHPYHFEEPILEEVNPYGV